MTRSAFIFACLAAGCSASDDPSHLSLGRDGAGGATSSPPGATAGAAGGLVITGDAGASRALTAHIENTSGLAIELVTLSCSNECADVLAVARGGFAPYSYRWEDGSTAPARHVCPTATTTLVVSATDSGSQSHEFTVAPQTA